MKCHLIHYESIKMKSLNAYRVHVFLVKLQFPIYSAVLRFRTGCCDCELFPVPVLKEFIPGFVIGIKSLSGTNAFYGAVLDFDPGAAWQQNRLWIFRMLILWKINSDKYKN